MPQVALTSDPSTTLTKALRRAGQGLGLSLDVLGRVVGRDRTVFSRKGIAPDSKAGELALLLIRAYRGLYALVGGDTGAMHHWMQTENRHTGGVPAEQVATVTGLVRVVEYLDAIRGKI